MKVLIAEDDAVSRRVLEAALASSGHEVVAARDGAEAWAALRLDDAPSLAVLDWMMPVIDGPEVCRRVRQAPGGRVQPYLILLTAKGDKRDVASGLESGADDYLVKPFDRGELRARLQVGARVVELQRGLAQRVTELEEALARVRQLQGMLPICSYCKKIRDDQNYWQGIEDYISDHSEAQFSHGICPCCYERLVAPEIAKLRRTSEGAG